MQNSLRGRISGSGPDRRVRNRLSRTVSPYALTPQQIEVQVGWSRAVEPTKLYISNLAYKVTNDDIKILFSEVGELKLHSIHYDQSGRSKGTGEVVYVQHSDAMQAMKKYNNCLLDGKPLKIELVGVDLATPLELPPGGDGILGAYNPAGSVYGHGKNLGQVLHQQHSNPVGSVGHGHARDPERRKNNDEKKPTAEELDAELERYHLDALQID